MENKKDIINKYYKQILFAISLEDPSQFDDKMLKKIILDIYQERKNNN